MSRVPSYITLDFPVGYGIILLEIENFNMLSFFFSYSLINSRRILLLGRYVAPEVYRSEEYDTKVDVFSFALILQEVKTLLYTIWMDLIEM